MRVETHPGLKLVRVKEWFPEKIYLAVSRILNQLPNQTLFQITLRYMGGYQNGDDPTSYALPLNLPGDYIHPESSCQHKEHGFQAFSIIISGSSGWRSRTALPPLTAISRNPEPPKRASILPCSTEL